MALTNNDFRISLFNGRLHNACDPGTVKVYLSAEQVSFDANFLGYSIEFLSVVLAPEVNEWLTDNCDIRWCVYVEYASNLLSEPRKLDSWSIFFTNDQYLDILKPFIGFQLEDDAILFKLST